MDYNLLNGGLVLKVEDNLIISDVKKLATVFNDADKGMFWFMNFDGTSIFYSDQKQENALYRLDLESGEQKLLLGKPCYGLLLDNDWLYFINENDRNVYRCLRNGKSETRIIDEEAGSFILENGKIYYTTPHGIRVCNEMGAERELVNDAAASNLLLIDEKLVFTDTKNRHLLTIMDLNTQSTKALEGMAVSSLNTDGKYLYCANRLNDRSIYRVCPENGSSIRICGESAEYLHVIENELYFCLKQEWYKMSLVGGQYQKIEVNK